MNNTESCLSAATAPAAPVTTPARFVQNLLSTDLRLILEAEQSGGVDQLQHARKLLLGKVREEVLLDRPVGADVAALGCVEAVRVVLARDGCNEGVDDRCGASLAEVT